MLDGEPQTHKAYLASGRAVIESTAAEKRPSHLHLVRPVPTGVKPILDHEFHER